jgi:glycosyltransferase involved in cell wall biosynthesis
VRDVFIVCNNFEELGGLQRWVHHIGRLLAGRGHRVHLIGVIHAEKAHDYGSDLPYTTTVLHETSPPAMGGGRMQRRRRDAASRKGAARLSSVLAGAQPGSVVIAAQVWAMEWVAKADTKGLQVIGMSHESYEATKGSTRFDRVKRYFADVDRFLTLTEEDADRWAVAGMSNSDSMPNPLHVEPAVTSPLTEKVVVRLGRLSFEKGQDLLLEAWAQLADRHPDWRLRLYGSGPEEAALHRMAADLGLTTVEFPGATADLEGALTGASIFALSSREEGFPMSILESMAYGLPTVAFDCAPGVRELLTHEVDGLIVNPGNTADLAAQLERLMNDPALGAKYGHAAMESVQRFSADKVVDRWERLFDLLDR